MSVIIYFVLQFPITALREIRILQKLRHENIVRLIEICYDNKGAFYLRVIIIIYNM